METTSEHINKWLLPLSWLYGCILSIRNKFFDWGILKESTYPFISIICVGNLTVGGTGKTPHIEYLVRLLSAKYRVAVLSRGYKRRGKGYILSDESSTSSDIGDEPYQIKRKFPEIIVAVDADRRNGVNRLLELEEEKRPEIILLDDGFQHRWVKPSFSILLSDCNRPVYEDTLLPAGRLRERLSSLQRANIVLATKCPPEIKPIDMRIATNSFGLYPYQSLMFTTMKYGQLTPLDESNTKVLELSQLVDKHVLLVTGIASPKPLEEKLSEFSDKVTPIAFPDHHYFSDLDIETIYEQFVELPEEKRMVITTEKDAVRLAMMNLPDEMKPNIYYLPISVAFLNEEEQISFNKKILNHVRKNTRNSQLHPEENI